MLHKQIIEFTHILCQLVLDQQTIFHQCVLYLVWFLIFLEGVINRYLLLHRTEFNSDNKFTL
jgi:hypothetical protein